MHSAHPHMRTHRISYLRTTLGAFCIAASALALGIYWFPIGWHMLATGRASAQFHIFFWFTILMACLLVVFGLMVGFGGVLSLEKDARESGLK
jgi:hypothetical protein